MKPDKIKSVVVIGGKTFHYGLTSDEERLVLAAVFHDIGKVSTVFLKEDHGKCGSKFIEKVKSLPEELRKYIADVVINHHENIDREELKIIKQADIISARAERTKLKGEEEKEEDIRGRREDTPLLSIISTIGMSESDVRNGMREANQSTLKFFPMISLEDFLGKFNIEESYKEGYKRFMPAEKAQAVRVSRAIIENKESQTLTECYKIINERLLKALNSLDYSDPYFLDALDAVLMNHLIFVPSAVYVDVPDIPLYHHLKMTAAIALILFRSRNTPHKNKIALIEGDVSGIQDFIFYTYRGEGSEKGASKRLRGRSFYVSLLSDAVVRYILHELRLTPFNIVSKAGGHFMILAPYTNELEKMVREFQENVNRFLYSRHGGILKIAIGVGVEDINKEGWFSSLLKKARIDTEMKKLRFEMFGRKELDREDAPTGEDETCRVCGLRKVRQEGEDDEFQKCEKCFQLEMVGGRVVRSSFLRARINDFEEERSHIAFKFGDFSIRYYLDGKSEGADLVLLLKPSQSSQGVHGYFITGSYTPVEKGEDGKSVRVKTLEELTWVDGARVDEEKRNAYLAMLKADVDNLGHVFRFGFVDRLSPSRLATLSFQLDLFFTKIVNEVARVHDCYVVFSGGDDLTVVGRIDRLLSFTHDMRKLFHTWCGGNEKIGISAGFYFNSHKFPIFRMVENASRFLDLSKEGEKNRITMFDENENLQWEKFWKAIELYHTFAALSNDKADKERALSRSVFYKLLTVENLTLPYNEEEQTKKLARGRPVIVVPEIYIYYIISRNWRGNNVEEMKEFIEKVRKASRAYKEGGYLSFALKMFLVLTRFGLDFIPAIKLDEVIVNG